MSILIFDWLPDSEKSWFAVQVEDLFLKRTFIVKYVFDEDNRCVWTDSNYEDYSIDKINNLKYSVI